MIVFLRAIGCDPWNMTRCLVLYLRGGNEGSETGGGGKMTSLFGNRGRGMPRASSSAACDSKASVTALWTC